MTNTIQRIFQKSICSDFLRLGLIGFALIALQATPASAQWTTPDAGGNINSTNSGNVGIGTASPGAKLDVVGGSYNSGIRITSSSATGSGLTVKSTDTGGHEFNIFATATNIAGGAGGLHIFDTTANKLRLRIAPSGDIGIGTATPATILSVNLSNTDFTNINGAGSHLAMTNPSATGQNVVTSIINGATVAKWRTDYVGNISWIAGPTGKHDFYTGGDFQTGTVKMTILNGGNVGIGSGATNPNAKLQVSGNVNVTAIGAEPGNITAAGTIEANIIKAKYQDVAEWVPASEQIPAGMVVVLDSTKSNHVIVSTKGYDTRVAGVISEQPGITLGEAGDSKVLVATTGRVRIKVDASRGPIHIGDLLVTSDVPGLAMKSEPIKVGGRLMHMPGTIIGKALEPLAKGSGEILVLLSLQ